MLQTGLGLNATILPLKQNRFETTSFIDDGVRIVITRKDYTVSKVMSNDSKQPTV
jgi:hypothetical protein